VYQIPLNGSSKSNWLVQVLQFSILSMRSSGSSSFKLSTLRCGIPINSKERRLYKKNLFSSSNIIERCRGVVSSYFRSSVVKARKITCCRDQMGQLPGYRCNAPVRCFGFAIHSLNLSVRVSLNLLLCVAVCSGLSPWAIVIVSIENSDLWSSSDIAS
jgi:hypothetical protein